MHLSESDTLGAGDFQLQISAVSEAVEVAAQGAVVQTESGDRIQVIDSSEVQDRLARGRDAMAMLQILPGVLNDDTGSDVVCQFATPKSGTSYQANIGIQRQIGFGTVVDVGYVGDFGRHLGEVVQLNEVPDGADFPAPQQIFQGNSSYHSLLGEFSARSAPVP